MVSQKICPSKLQLRSLIEGNLTDVEESELAGHVDQCEKCQRVIERLAPARDELLPVRVNGSELQMETREQALKIAMQRLRKVADEEKVGEDEMETRCDAANDDDSLGVLTPSDDPQALGRLGTYEIMGIIGRGGMGTVFKAIDTTLHRVVAVKILSPMLASNGAARQRFVREARSAAAVVHDHVITIHAVDEIDGQPYLVMQFVSGCSLQQKLDRDGPLEVKEILRIAKQTASGLAAAHDQGLIHRDIKPANILLENGVERVNITDFGLARTVDDASITHADVIAGTPQYMAPEQANGEVLDQRADLFSLGSVMYAMCTGRPPFLADNTVATLRSVSDTHPRPIRELNPDIPQWLVETIEKLLEKEPANRFQSARVLEHHLAEQLARLQQPGQRWSTPPESSDGKRLDERSQPPRQRRLRRSIVAFALTPLVVAIGLGVSDWAGATNIIQTLATVFRIETSKGTVAVEVDDPNATVTVDGQEIAIGADGFEELRLKPGAYDLAVQRGGDAPQIRRVTVTKNSREVLRISFEKHPASVTAKVEAPLKRETIHTCPMHPQVKVQGSGRCPICNMTLVPAAPQFTGVVECDVRHVSIIRNRFPARVERLYVDHAGIEVKRGDELAQLQSGELYAAEEELLQAVKAADGDSPSGSRAAALVTAAREKLSLWGFTKAQIDQIVEQNKATGLLTLHAPADGIVMAKNVDEGQRVASDSHLLTIADPTRLWVQLQVSELDIGSVRLGQQVAVSADAYPDERFIGKITFIDPHVDSATLTIKVRVDLKHPEQKLKPGMTALGVVVKS